MASIQPRKPESDTPAIAPLSILRILWKRKLVVVAVLLTLSAVAGVVVMRLPAIYQAEALVLVDSQKIPEKFVSSTVSSGVADRLAAISQEIMSTTRLLKIINDLDLYKKERKTKTQEEVVEQMRRDISVTVQKDNWATGKPVAFKVGYQGRTPAVVAEVANQLANLYIEENLQTREVEASGTSDFIDTQLSEAKHQLDEEEAKVAHFKQEHNGSLPEQENPLLSTLSNLRVQLQGIQDAANRAQQNRLMLEASLATEQSNEASMERAVQASATGKGGGDVLVTEDPGSADGKSLPALRRELETLESRYTPDHPDVIALKAEIAHMEQVQQANTPLPTAKSASQPAAASKSAPISVLVTREVLQERGKITMLQAQLAAVKRDIEFNDAERQRILQQINAAQSKVEQLPIVEQQMVGLTRDYEVSKANYQSLLDKQIAAQMSSDMERRQKSERFEIIDPARVPEKPIKPNRPLFLGIGVVAALVLGLAVGFGIELRNPVLLGEWELPEGVTVLGRVPVIDMRVHGKKNRKGRMQTVIAGSASACVLAAATVAYYFMRGQL